MDVNDIINSLNQILDLGDRLDNAGGGVHALSDGKHTTREVCRIELSQFLLYIADASSVINDTQAAVLNIVLGDDYADVPAYKVKELAKTANVPDPDRNMTLIVFQHADTVLSRQNGGSTASLAELLVSVYEAFGMLMVAANENAIAKSRYDSAISEFKAKISSGGSASDRSAASPIRAGADDDFVISDGVLTDYKGPGGDVVIPDGVTRIDDNAFCGIDSIINHVSIPESVESIGDSAFSWTNLTSIDIPASVKSIESGAFCYCTKLEQIRMPATLTDIDDEAFSNCDKLKTVIVYGGKRDEAAEDALKKLFVKRVKVIWEGDETSKPKKKTTTSTKKTTAGKKSSASEKKTSSKASNKQSKTIEGGQLVEYNEHVAFDLSREYKMVWDKDDDGNDRCQIVSQKTTDDDDETPETSFAISIVKNDESDKELLDVIENNEEDKGTKIRFHSDPDALLTITYMDMQILSISFRTSIYRLYIRLSLEESLLILFLNTSADGKNDLMGDITKLIELWRCVCIDGEAVDMGEAETAQSFVNYLSELSNHEGKPKQQKAASSKASSASSKAKKQKREKETIIRTKPARFPDAGQYKGIHEVEDGPETIVPVGKWSIQVSPGRSYTMDPEYIRSSFAGQYILQIQSTEDRNFDKAFDSGFNLVIFPSANTMDAYSVLTDLSSDEAADAMMEVAAASGKGYSFFKRTRSLVVMIKTVTEKQKEYSVMFLVFSRGTQLAANGQIVVRGQTQKMAKEEVKAVLNSIAAIGQPEGEEYYKPFVLPEQFGLTYHNHQILRLDDVITLPIPDGFKASTDRALIGGHRKFAIVPEDFDDFSNAMDAFIGINSVAQGQLPKFTQEDCDEVVSEICRQLISSDGFGANIGIVIAQMTTKGIIFYQRMYGMDTNKYVMGKVVIWTDRFSYSVNFALNFDEAIADRLYVNIDAEQIIADWLNRIELPGDKLYYIPSESEPDMNQDRISNLICPPAPEILHEHFDLVTSGGYTTRRDADFIGQPVRKLMENCGSTDEDAYDMMTIAGDNYELDKTSKKLAQLFRLEKSLFDPYTDQEALIRLGAFSDVRMLHALRSLSWTASRYAAQEHCSLAEIPFADLQKMSDLIEKRNYLNYDGETGFVNLCNHYDWHVFYVPDAYLSSSTAMQTDLRYLTGKENRGGNTTMTVFLSGTGTDSMRDMHHNNEIISRNEETMESLESLRKDLEALLPVMQTIYEGFIKDRNRKEKLEGALADALTAWCALAVAAKEPFYSEEAADTPEANAGLDGPLERPTDDLDDLSPSKSGNAVAKQTTRKKTTPLPKGEMLDLEGETVIKSGQFAGNMNLQNIIIPEGVTEIGEGAFYSCMLLETVAFPKSLRKIGKMAFMSCRSLKQVDLPEGVEELETHVFGATNNLKEVHLPDSLKKVDRCVFGLGGDSPYATAYLSGKLAKQLYEVNGDAFNDIYARHIIIDGNPYDSVKAYLYTIGIHAKGYYPPYDPEAAARAAEERARREEERQKQYRPNMEAACKAGKPLQDMIEVGRRAVNANEYGDKDAFEQAIKNLDKTATVTFEGKHFVLSGFGIYEEDVIAEIEKRGGIIHSSMVKMADYLVVCLESPGAAKLKKALEWRQKGASNLIVSDYQMWQAIFGNVTTTSGTKKASAAKSMKSTSASTGKSKVSTEKEATQEAKNTAPATTRKKKTSSMPALPNETVDTAALTMNHTFNAPEKNEAAETLQTAQDTLKKVTSQTSATVSAFEKYSEIQQQQEKDKQRRMEEAKKKGKSSHDEVDMLVILLNEEALGQLNRDDKEFSEIYAEDFASYNAQQIIRMRKKVMPTIHDAETIRAAREDMLARSVKERFSVSTGNYFNVCTDWDLDAKGNAAIEATKQWYMENEIPQLRQLMEEHKDKPRQSVFDQLSSLRPEWASYSGLRDDLHIFISENDNPVPEAHNLFHVKLDGGLDVHINITNPSVGFITVPVMNIFASCWKVTPEEIWNTALRNDINDSRGQSFATRRDALAAKDKALSRIRKNTAPTAAAPAQPAVTAPQYQSASSPIRSNAQAANPNAKRIKELEESIAALQKEADSTGGLFGFIKRNKIKKEIEAQQQELNRLRKQRN